MMRHRSIAIGLSVLLALPAAGGCTAETQQKQEIEETEEMSSEEEAVIMERFDINLPKEYYMEMSVKNSSGFGTQTTAYALSEKDGFYYMKLGYDREQYVYEPVSEGKYIEYKYDESKRAYAATMISEPLRLQIEAGNISLDSVTVGRTMIDTKISTLDPYFFGYQTLTAALSYQGKETILGRECEKYAGTIDTVAVKSDLEFWVDPETGVVMRSTNKTNAVLVKIKQLNEMTVFEAEGRIPSVK